MFFILYKFFSFLLYMDYLNQNQNIFPNLEYLHNLIKKIETKKNRTPKNKQWKIWKA